MTDNMAMPSNLFWGSIFVYNECSQSNSFRKQELFGFTGVFDFKYVNLTTRTPVSCMKEINSVLLTELNAMIQSAILLSVAMQGRADEGKQMNCSILFVKNTFDIFT
jgi:hypothetical protein